MSLATPTTDDTTQVTFDQALALVASQGKLLKQQQQTIYELQHQLDWFKRQLFGSKSERRIVDYNPDQLALALGGKSPAGVPLPPKRETTTSQRGKGKKQRASDCVNDTGLRFGPDVPIETIELPVPAKDSQSGAALEVIGMETFYRLAQRPGSYVVICYKQPVVKNLSTQQIAHIDSPGGIFERSVADVSFLAGMLVDKFQFHRVPRVWAS